MNDDAKLMREAADLIEAADDAPPNTWNRGYRPIDMMIRRLRARADALDEAERLPTVVPAALRPDIRTTVFAALENACDSGYERDILGDPATVAADLLDHDAEVEGLLTDFFTDSVESVGEATTEDLAAIVAAWQTAYRAACGHGLINDDGVCQSCGTAFGPPSTWPNGGSRG